MKVWARIKSDGDYITINVSNAVEGFKMLGCEIVTYNYLTEEILKEITSDDIVLDGILQCDTVFKKFGVEPHVEDYPEEFRKFMGRKVWKDTINSISSDEKKWSAGNFVKPVKDKIFTGKIINSIADLVGCGSCYENYEVLVTEPLDIKAEWRCFILRDNIIDIRPYGLLLGRHDDAWKYHYDTELVEEMLETFKTMKDRPLACSMDIAVVNTDKGLKTVLVEFNDAYALGCYGLSSIYYTKLISARWSQLLDRPDEFVF